MKKNHFLVCHKHENSTRRKKVYHPLVIYEHVKWMKSWSTNMKIYLRNQYEMTIWEVPIPDSCSDIELGERSIFSDPQIVILHIFTSKPGKYLW